MQSTDGAPLLSPHSSRIVDIDPDEATDLDSSVFHDLNNNPLSHRPHTPHTSLLPYPLPSSISLLPPRSFSDPTHPLPRPLPPLTVSSTPPLAPSMLASYFRRTSHPHLFSDSRPASTVTSPRSPTLPSHPYARTLLYCILFTFLCLFIFLCEYIYIDHKYHLVESSRHQQTASLLSSAHTQLQTVALELDSTQSLVHSHEQTIDTLTHQLSQRDDALLMYRQLVTDLQEKSAATEAEQALTLQHAQAQASHVLNQTSYLFQKSEVATVETVTRVKQGLKGEDGVTRNSSASDSEAVATKLVDSANNEYILSSPTDSSLKTVDSRLILDLGIVIISAAIGGLLASLMQQPPLLGYLLAGSAIGPGGLRLIGQFVQVETLAEFGATFLLFALGVEFSWARLTRVRVVAFGAGGLSMTVIVGVVGVLGWIGLGLTIGKGLFVGAVLSMSSTTVVVKSLMERRGELDSKVGQIMLGLLIVQDIALSFLLSIITLTSSSSNDLLHDIVIHCMKFVLLGVIVICCAFLWPLALRMLDYSKSHDLFLLGLVALCVTLTVVADKVIGSAEVGAFLAGILVSSSPTASVELTKRSLRLFEPIRDMFGALFFSSMGMLINPVFLLNNFKEVVLLVGITVVLKTLVTWGAVRLFKVSMEDALHIGLCLSQIGEFAFVLASQGLRAGLLEREDYMLLLGVTAVSIFVTPALIGGSFLMRKGWGRVEGGREGSDGGLDGAPDERMGLRNDGAHREEGESRRKEKMSDAEQLWKAQLAVDEETLPSTPVPSETLFERTSPEDEDVREGHVRSLHATRPLKRQASRERPLVVESGVSADMSSSSSAGDSERKGGGGGSNWKERRKQRQMEKAKALMEEKKIEEAAKVKSMKDKEKVKDKEKEEEDATRIRIEERKDYPDL